MRSFGHCLLLEFTHPSICFPLLCHLLRCAVHSQSIRRTLLAKMTDSNGEETAQPQPLPLESALQPARYCSHCGEEPETLSTCSECHVAKYCSQSCQRSDWPLHKQFCSQCATEKGRVTIQGPPLSINDQWINLHAYWHVYAARDPAAQQVASTLRINLVPWSGCLRSSCRAIEYVFPCSSGFQNANRFSALLSAVSSAQATIPTETLPYSLEKIRSLVSRIPQPT